MIPFRDNNPTHHTPHVTVALIAINIAVFVFAEWLPGSEVMQRVVWKYGFVPAEFSVGSRKLAEKMKEINDGQQPRMMIDRRGRVLVEPAPQLPVEEATALPATINLLTCMFLHGSWMHLLGNMLYLWIFGNNIEDRLGPVLFSIFYLGTGIVGSLAHTWFDPGVIPLVGASGAISGVMGAYVLLFPHARILAFVPAYLAWFTVSLPAWMFLGVYYLIQNVVPAFRGGGDNVAYWAHIGGFVAGAGAIYLFPKRPAVRRAVPAPPDDADFQL